MTSIELFGPIIDAINFSAQKHQHQKRPKVPLGKNEAKTPFINHPIAVANIVSKFGSQMKIEDLDNVIIAAFLHDVIEDTNTEPEEILERFGAKVLQYVLEVSDDKTLPKAERKKLQVQHAKVATPGAKLIKMADAYHNMTTLLKDAPKSWSKERIQGYFIWKRAVLINIGPLCRPFEIVLHKFFESEHFVFEGVSYPIIPRGKDVDLGVLLEKYYEEMTVTED